MMEDGTFEFLVEYKRRDEICSLAFTTPTAANRWATVVRVVGVEAALEILRQAVADDDDTNRPDEL